MLQCQHFSMPANQSEHEGRSESELEEREYHLPKPMCSPCSRLNSESGTIILKKNILLSLSSLLNSSAKFSSFCSFEPITCLCCQLLFTSPGWHHCLHDCEVCPDINFMWRLCRVEHVLPRAFLKHDHDSELQHFSEFDFWQRVWLCFDTCFSYISLSNETFWPIL